MDDKTPERLSRLLACPKCMGPVALKGMFLGCERCGLAYPVIDGVPDMRSEAAWEAGKAGKAGFRHGLRL
jgi:uncharacterized protein YbaR (Trm112 family)